MQLYYFMWHYVVILVFYKLRSTMPQRKPSGRHSFSMGDDNFNFNHLVLLVTWTTTVLCKNQTMTMHTRMLTLTTACPTFKTASNAITRHTQILMPAFCSKRADLHTELIQRGKENPAEKGGQSSVWNNTFMFSIFRVAGLSYLVEALDMCELEAPPTSLHTLAKYPHTPLRTAINLRYIQINNSILLFAH